MNCDGVSNLLSAYLDGELSPGELLRVEEHLRRCHCCADEVDSLRQTISLVSSLEEVELPATFQLQLHQRLVALGPPVAAVRRAPAAPAWQRNVRRWAVPAAAAAAALAIGITQLSPDLLTGGLKAGEGKFTLQPPPEKVVVTNTVTNDPKPVETVVDRTPTNLHPEVQAVPPNTPPAVDPGPGPTTPNPNGVVGVTVDEVPKSDVKPTPKLMAYAYNVTVKGALDPAVETRIRLENTQVQTANNTMTIKVPVVSREEWLARVVNDYFPKSEYVDASQPRDAEVAEATARYDAAFRQKQLDEKDNRPDKEAVLALDDKAIADAKEELDLIKDQTTSATIVVTFVAP